MNFIESIKIALKALWINKMRSLLTMLGIIIGISSVITVVALGNGTKGAVNSEFDNYGASSIYIFNRYSEEIYQEDLITNRDYEVLGRIFEKQIEAKSAIINYSGVTNKINDVKKDINLDVNGVGNEYDKVINFELISGRFLSKQDIVSRKNVAVIEKELAIEKFGKEDVLGEKLSIKRNDEVKTFIIVGIYEPPKSLLPAMGERAKVVYIPTTTAGRVLNLSDQIYFMQFSLKKDVDAENVIMQMINVLERKHKNIDQNKFQGESAEGQLEIINKVMKILTSVVGAIAAISLIVGGIGIMNIMLVSVTERTREIGIRKAIGATRKDILIQFLIEAIVISGIGGVIGTAIGIILSKIVSHFIKIPATTGILVIIIATLFSTMVGIAAGMYPANKAAKLDPIDALRYE
ncbi:ABC transporter permease [Clostridiaceae bacterium HSG29]|nr:ABC transporter permease [Clostridiaceae bacterium HSG29]